MADDFSEKLSAVLGNPEAMGQIMSLARSISGESAEEEPQPEGTGDTALPPAVVQAPQSMPDLSGLMGMLGGLMGGGQQSGGGDALSALSNLDPRLIQLGVGLLSEYNRGDDRSAALLAALKPFLKEERAAKIQRAAQAAKLSRLVRVALRMFKEGGED